MPTISQALTIALLHHQAGRLDLAEAIYRRVVEAEPAAAEVWVNLGLALEGQQKLDEAATCYLRAATLKSDWAVPHFNLGNLLRAGGKPEQALEWLRRAEMIQPDLAGAHIAEGNALLDLGRPEEAVPCYHRAIELVPASAEVHNNLGVAMESLGRLDEAIQCYRRAIALKTDYAEAYNNLGHAVQAQAGVDEAIACYRRAVELRPDLAYLHSNLVCATHFSPAYDAAAIADEARRWARQHAAPLRSSITPHPNDRSPDRRLRIGYVSPDFREHPVGRFLLPLLESHDHDRFEIFCYSSVRITDAITERMRAACDVWRDVAQLPDEPLADVVRQDRIDILVDLTMHMLANRLLLFARQPAPVQVTYLAYCGTTGLDTIAYRFTDPHLDPPACPEFYTEESIRLPETYWCYRPAVDTPAVNELPALTGPVTFGCLNNFCKVSPPTLAAWTQLLRTVPESRLVLHAHAGGHRQRVLDHFAREGVDPGRLEFVGLLPIGEYFDVYRRIDVGLDPFPYGGGTTTCDALWMGVPVVSLAGRTAVGRGGLSILSNLGLPELVAHDAQQYVRIAAGLAADRPRLSALRAALRGRMQASPLTDAPRFARHVEQAYRTLWRRWCERT